jgi:hypothetical protein
MPLGPFRMNTIGRTGSTTYFTYVGAGESTLSTTVIFPAGIQSGDIAFMFDTQASSNTTVPTTVTPSGWTNITTAITNSTLQATRTCLSYKVCAGTESSTSVTGMTAGSLRGEKKIVVYRPSSAITAVTPSTITSQATTSAPTNQTLTMATGVTAPFIGFAWYFSSGGITTRGSTTTPTREIGLARGWLKTFEANKTGQTFANSTISMADYGTNVLVSFKVSLTLAG